MPSPDSSSPIGPVGVRVVVSEYGETPLDALEHHVRLEAQPPPDPSTLADTDVVLRVRSCAVGWVDLLMMSGQYQHMVAPPYTPGLEFAGDVAWVGSAVQRVAVGDRVLADGFSAGPRSSGAHQKYGGFSTWVVIPEHAAIPAPPQLSYDHCVNLLGNYETAVHVLVDRGRIQEGDVVVIHGASGSTGLAGVQVAKMYGATVIATGRNLEKLEAVKALGADHIVQTVDPDGQLRKFRTDIKALTNGRGADIVWDGVGGDISVESLRCLRFGGKLCIVGWAATPFVARGKGQRGAPRANQLPTNIIQMKGLDVLGCPAVISTKFDPSLRPRRLKWIFEQVAAGALVPHVGPVFALEDFDSALRHKWRSGSVGGCVLRV
jgi:NADPH2:quinone reductase